MVKDQKKKSEVTVSSGNIYADLGYPNPEECLAKAELTQLIIEAIEEKNLTQKKAAKLMGIDQPKVSALIRGNFSGFSIDRLFRFLLALGMDIFISANPHKKKSSEPRIHVAPEFIPPQCTQQYRHQRKAAAA